MDRANKGPRTKGRGPRAQAEDTAGPRSPGISRRPSGPNSGRSPPGRVRIVGGLYRGRRLLVPDRPGLRPTPDRVRETLFNWLAPSILGSRCLDLFAGSGALGFEAASRGAGEVVLVEREAALARQLRASVRTLGAEQIQVVESEALSWLTAPTSIPRVFDLVFLDPPFSDGLLGPACAALVQHRRLASGAHIYLETDKRTGLPPLPPGWEPVREGTAGQVHYALVLSHE